MLEQQDRGEQRKLKAIWYAERHKTPKKPEAPVAAEPKLKGEPRMWKWTGESIPSKGFTAGEVYSVEQIRAAGFKLPKMEKPPPKPKRVKKEKQQA
jgi:hypothetical protein